LRDAHSLLTHAEREGAPLSGSLRQDRESFRETLALLESSGSLVRLEDGEGEILYVPEEKRVNLDFYKNNSVHLFVLPSLVSHALHRGLRAADVTEELWWWLELFRNEFVLPERDTLAARVQDLLDRMGPPPADGAGPCPGLSPFAVVAAPILQNFREAYWVAAKAVRLLAATGESEADLLERMRRAYRAGLLLGTLRKPEGNTTVTLQNALERLRELGCVRRDAGGTRAASRMFPGPDHPGVFEIERRLMEAITTPDPRS
jgi:glycerol-3-phosphate O-acyltransferase